MEKEHILDEIVRTTEENDGVPLGRVRFEKETGIKYHDWYGRHWAKWGDALTEAGYAPNKFNQAFDEEFIIKKLINLIQELGKWPTEGELRIKVRQDKTYPAQSVFARLGKKSERIEKTMEYCQGNPDLQAVFQICQSARQPEKERVSTQQQKKDLPVGFVYLMKSGKHYKLGRSNSADRRHYELKILMPEKLHLVHKIKTDDPAGIEAYWHRRFENNRLNGEWFGLSPADVKAFKRRKFM